MKPDIVFYQQYAVPYFGVLSLAANLGYNGYSCDAIIDSLEKNPLTVLKELNPKLIGIPVLSTEHKWLIEKTRLLRKAFPGVTIIIGGIHAMFYPEEILKESSCDLVCNSEGEHVLLKVIKELDKANPEWDAIAGLSYRQQNGLIRHNGLAELVPFNDEIIEDRAVYYGRYPFLAGDLVHRFFSSRGCPYKCAFCYNANIQELFKGKGAYVRRKSVESFIKEISLQVSKYSIKLVFFYDDLFTFDKLWLKNFLFRYKKEIGLPFMCTTRANLIDEDIARELKEAGCRTVSFGVETGNYGIRSRILNKEISDDEIINCGRLLHKFGMKTQTANMFCLPEETLEDAYKTIELNIRAKTDYAFSAFFLPFPKTKIADYCIQHGFLKNGYSLENLPRSFLTSSVLDLTDKQAIVNVHRLAFFFVCYPLFFRVFKKIVRFTFFNAFFRFIFLCENYLRHVSERGISFIASLRYVWRMRKSF